MDLSDDFDLSGEDIPASARLQAEWMGISAIREMISFARRSDSHVSYLDALAIGKELSPDLYDNPKTLIGRSHETPIVSEYKQRAEAKSRIAGQSTTPLDLINADIAELEILIKVDRTKKALAAKLSQLQAARLHFLPQKFTETQVLIRDAKQVERHLPTSPSTNVKYTEYILSEGRGLRVYLLHPDAPEHSTCADLIYETYWDGRKLARLCAIQYKIWNGKVLYSSQAANLRDQMQKLSNVFCNAGLCQPAQRSSKEINYRLPFCAAFIRPTDKLQQPDSKLISSGLHLPVCVANRSWQPTGHGGEKIEKSKMRCESLSHEVFEKLYNTNMLGSRWLSYAEIEDLYSEHEILNADERIVIHAQEYTL